MGQWIRFVDALGRSLGCALTRLGACVALPADGSYQERTIIARTADPDSVSVGDVIAVGEMSITADGRFLYFTYMALRGPGDVDLSIGVARKR